MPEYMKWMSLALPEDVEKAKMAGDLSRAARIIAVREADPRTPECMRKRLELEEEVLRRLPAAYPYTEEDALAVARKEIPDFTMEELHNWEDRDAADWIYLNGAVHLQDRFFSSMKKVYPEIAQRCHESASSRALLDRNAAEMRQHGSAAWHIHLKVSLQLHTEAFRPGKRILVHLPIPSGAAMNMRNIRLLSAGPSEGRISAENYPAATVSFEEVLQDNHPFYAEYEYDSAVQYHEIDPAAAGPCPSFYTEEKAPAIVFTPLIRSLLEEIRGSETNPAAVARRIYDYCTTQVTYAFMREYMTIPCIPDYCGASLKGDCGVQALLFITLCRCAGIPARWQSGLYVTPDDVGNHDWAQFYLEPWGWLFADCSFGGSAYRAGSSLRHDFYFGNLDPFRMASADDVLAEFDPPKCQYRSDPYDNQSGEAEYEDFPLLRKDFEIERTIIEMHEIPQE